MAIVIIRFRRGLSSEWTIKNPILASGEPGFEADTGKLKIGNGVQHWADLPYYLDATDTAALVQQLLQDAVLEGVEGDSAYEVAVNNGFVGTEEEWLLSLKGADGLDGADGSDGADGADGVDGISYTGPKITVSSTTPLSPSVGDVWIDLSA